MINTFLLLANGLSTVASLDEPIDLSRGSFANQEQGFEKAQATMLATENKDIPMSKGTNDKKSGVENCAKIHKAIEHKINFDWIDCALTILSQKGPTKMKKLKKKVVNTYMIHHPETSKTREKLESKFDKKVGRSKKFTITNDMVSVVVNQTQNLEVQKENLPTQLVKSCQDAKKG